jgi:predicted nucleic acid-binding protein
MTAVIVDSSVTIDVLRRQSSAVAFISSLHRKPFVSVVSIMEMYAGARSRSEENRIESLLAGCEVLPVTATIARIGGQFSKHYRASHAIDDADALIAATAEQHGLALATLNVKHFPMFPKLKKAY